MLPLLAGPRAFGFKTSAQAPLPCVCWLWGEKADVPAECAWAGVAFN